MTNIKLLETITKNRIKQCQLFVIFLAISNFGLIIWYPHQIWKTEKIKTNLLCQFWMIKNLLEFNQHIQNNEYYGY